VAKKPYPFHIAYGDDDFMLGRHLVFGRSFGKRSIIQVDGDTISEADLLLVCESNSLDGLGRVVVLDNAQKLKGKDLARYIEDTDRNDLTTILVAVVRATRLPEPWSKVGSKGDVVTCHELKPWAEKDGIELIQAEAQKHKIKLAVEVPGLLWRTIGNRSSRLCNEISKLAVLVGPGGTVTKEHLKLVLASVPQADSYQAVQLAEATFRKDARGAMQKVSKLYKHMGEQASVPIASALMKQAERYYVARRMLDAGDAVDIVATRFGMGGKRTFFFKRDVLPAVKKHAARSLLDQMNSLCELDVKVKGSAHSKRSLVELAVLSIAA